MAAEKVRILRVITQAEVVPWHLKNFIDRSAHDYKVYITGDGVSRYKDEYPHISFIDNRILRKVSLVSDFVALVKLVRTCLQIKPQIIHSIMPKAGLLASIAGLLAGVKIRMHTYTGQVWATKTGPSRRFYQLIDKLILQLCSKCLTDSPSQSQFLNDNGLLEDGKPIAYLGKGSLSGVDLNRFDVQLVRNRNAFRKELGIADEDFVFTFLARKSVVKGINELFESFAQIAHLPNVKLLFIGPDESQGRLAELYLEYQSLLPKIINLDIVKAHEKYLSVSDVLCLPSSSEGFGTIVIEAAALGVPAIGFEIVGLTDAIVNDSTGFLVPFKDVKKFSAAMSELYYNRGKLSQMSFAARSRVLDHFSADVLYNHQSNFYISLMTTLDQQ